MMKISSLNKIAVLYGGETPERRVSIHSGTQIINSLKKMGFWVCGIDAKGNFIDELLKSQYDFVFNALHGGIGENGVINGLLDHFKIYHSGASVSACSLAMDQIQSLRIWQSLALPVPDFILCKKTDISSAKQFNLPIAIKPCNQGSSIGVTKLKSWDEFDTAYKKASCYGDVVIQPWIEGKEYTVSIIGETILPSILIEPEREFYDYIAKTDKASGTRFHCPSDLSQKDESMIKLLAKKGFDALGGSGWGRVDIIRDMNGKFFLLEVNMVPGMTEMSLVPRAAKAHGWKFEDLLERIITLNIFS